MGKHSGWELWDAIATVIAESPDATFDAMCARVGTNRERVRAAFRERERFLEWARSVPDEWSARDPAAIPDAAPIEALCYRPDISGRLKNSLRNMGLRCVGEIKLIADSEFLSNPNLGRKSLAEVRGIWTFEAGSTSAQVREELLFWLAAGRHANEPAAKRRGMRRLLDGASITEVARECGAKPSTVGVWSGALRWRAKQAEMRITQGPLSDLPDEFPLTDIDCRGDVPNGVLAAARYLGLSTVGDLRRVNDADLLSSKCSLGKKKLAAMRRIWPKQPGDVVINIKQAERRFYPSIVPVLAEDAARRSEDIVVTSSLCGDTKFIGRDVEKMTESELRRQVINLREVVASQADLIDEIEEELAREKVSNKGKR